MAARQDRALFLPGWTPRQRRGQRQPHQRNIDQDAERVLDGSMARRQGSSEIFPTKGKPACHDNRLQKIDAEVPQR